MSERQPMPTPNSNPAIVDLALADLRQRGALGVKTYGTRLQAHNGRDSLRDAYEEALDMALYLRQCIEERRAQDLTLEDVDTLRWMRAQAQRADAGAPTNNTQRALTVLDKLLAGGAK